MDEKIVSDLPFLSKISLGYQISAEVFDQNLLFLQRYTDKLENLCQLAPSHPCRH